MKYLIEDAIEILIARNNEGDIKRAYELINSVGSMLISQPGVEEFQVGKTRYIVMFMDESNLHVVSIMVA